MKRLTAFFLALLLALTAIPALGAEEVELPEKFLNQVRDSGYTGTISFTVEGDATAAIDPVTWTLLKSLAPRLGVESGSSCIYRTGEGQGELRLMLDGQEIGYTQFIYNNDMGGLSSTLLGDGDVYYTAPRSWDFAPLYTGLLNQNQAWPSLWGALLKVEQAPQEWHDRIAPHLLPYETKVGVWINGYAAFSTGAEDDVAYTQLKCSIPVQAVKTQIKQLMVDFFEDQDVLSALREVFSAQEAAAYLQPSMLNAFFTMIDQVEMEGTVEITRRYDTLGNPLLDSITLPFPASSPLSILTIALTPDEMGQRWGFAGQTREGMDFEISCVVGEEGIYTGSVYLLLPEEEADDSFIVEEEPGLRREIAFDYNFSWDPGQDSYALLTARYSRTVSGTLLIKPREGSQMPTQVLRMEANYDSGADQRSATRLNASLSWRDMDSDAAITAAFTGRTTAASSVASLDDVTGALRLDEMEQEGVNVLLQQWMQQLQSWLANVAVKLLPADTVEPEGLG